MVQSGGGRCRRKAEGPPHVGISTSPWDVRELSSVVILPFLHLRSCSIREPSMQVTRSEVCLRLCNTRNPQARDGRGVFRLPKVEPIRSTASSCRGCADYGEYIITICQSRPLLRGAVASRRAVNTAAPVFFAPRRPCSSPLRTQPGSRSVACPRWVGDRSSRSFRLTHDAGAAARSCSVAAGRGVRAAARGLSRCA